MAGAAADRAAYPPQVSPGRRPRPRLLADLSPLRESRDYRLLFAGHAVSFLGSQMTLVAMPYQVYRLTRSSLAVGMASLAALLPLLALSLLGGSIADAVDRRRLLLVAQLLLAATSAGLALNAGSRHPAVWPIFVLGALSAGLAGVDLPTRNAMMPNLVRRELFPAASALTQIRMQLGLAVGPALAGLVIARVGLAGAYWADVASFGVSAVAAWAISPQPPEGGGTRAGIASVREGLRYLRGQRLLVGTFVIDLNAMGFGMPRALFPALGTGLFHGGPATVGLLYAAPGAGALVGAVFTGWVGRVRRQGAAVVAAVMAWGAAIVVFGLVPWLPLGLLLLAVAGAADMVSAVFRSTILQLSLPDALRGRISAVHIAVVTSGPRLGDVESGVAAALTTPRFSVVSGGVACVLGALVVARLVPELARYDARAATAASTSREPG